MSLTRFWISLFALGVAAAASGEDAGWLAPTRDYRADTLMVTREGEMRGRVWASGQKERREFRLDGRNHVMILRKDRGKSFVLMPGQKMYLESEIDDEAAPGASGSELERKLVDRKVVNGVMTTEYRVFGLTRDGDDFEATMWMTEHEIPVRVVSGWGQDRLRMELTNLLVGKVEAARFEIPEGYKRFELPAPAKADLDAIRREHGR